MDNNLPKVPEQHIKFCLMHWPNVATRVTIDGVEYFWDPEENKKLTPNQ